MPSDIGKILVAVKPGQGGLPSEVYHARVLSQCLGAELRLVSCVYDSEVAVGLDKAEGEALAAQAGLLESERSLLRGFAASLSDWGTEAELSVRWGQPAHRVILDELERWDAQLLIVGADSGAPWGRVAWQLARRCSRPLLIARDSHFEGYETVLAAVDPLQRHAEPVGLDRRILEIATVLAKASEAKLLVGHVEPDPESYALASAVEVLPGVYYGKENIGAVHRRAVEELVAEFGIRPSQIELSRGDPAEALIDLAERHHADLIVMGTLKRSRLEESLLGSTAEKVVVDVPGDVLLVKHG